MKFIKINEDLKSKYTFDQIKKRIFSISNQSEFEEITLEIFRFQYKGNEIYRQYIDNLNINPYEVNELGKIPFLPIEFFKTHKIVSSQKKEEEIFFSSGTTGLNVSKHYIVDTKLYIESFLKSFLHFYGHPNQYKMMALVPSYMEKEGSSLIYMLTRLFQISGKEENGFYLRDDEKLFEQIKRSEENNEQTILFGVGYALLDFAEKYSLPLKNTIIIETGGMKGRRKEITKEEMYASLESSFPGVMIHSEYGMTELLSQAYSCGNAQFSTPSWMQVYIRDIYDPFSLMPDGKKGGINVIDLANIYSCSFLETKDIGAKYNDYFTVHGRIDNSDIRGCNLLLE